MTDRDVAKTLKKYGLAELPDVTRQIQEEARRSAEEAYHRNIQYGKERVERAELNRQALALLDAAGIEISYCYESSTVVNLGFFPNTPKGNRELQAKMREIRLALGCRLEHHATEATKELDKPRLKLVRQPVLYATVKVSFLRKPEKKGKCRIVHHVSRYTTVVCDNPVSNGLKKS